MYVPRTCPAAVHSDHLFMKENAHHNKVFGATFMVDDNFYLRERPTPSPSFSPPTALSFLSFPLFLFIRFPSSATTSFHLFSYFNRATRSCVYALRFLSRFEHKAAPRPVVGVLLVPSAAYTRS